MQFFPGFVYITKQLSLNKSHENHNLYLASEKLQVWGGILPKKPREMNSYEERQKDIAIKKTLFATSVIQLLKQEQNSAIQYIYT